METRGYFSKLISAALIINIGLPYHIAVAGGQRSAKSSNVRGAQRSPKSSSNNVSSNSGNRSVSQSKANVTNSAGQRGQELVVHKVDHDLTKVEGYSGSANSYLEMAGALDLAQQQILARIKEADEISVALSAKVGELIGLDPQGVVNDIPSPKVTETSPAKFDEYMRKMERERLAEMHKERYSFQKALENEDFVACINYEMNQIRSVAASDPNNSSTGSSSIYGYDENNDNPDDPKNEDEEKEKKKKDKFLGLSKKTWGWITAIGGVAVAGFSLYSMLKCQKKATPEPEGPEAASGATGNTGASGASGTDGGTGASGGGGASGDTGGGNGTGNAGSSNVDLGGGNGVPNLPNGGTYEEETTTTTKRKVIHNKPVKSEIRIKGSGQRTKSSEVRKLRYQMDPREFDLTQVELPNMNLQSILNYQSTLDSKNLFRSQAAEKKGKGCMWWIIGIIAGIALVFMGIKMIQKAKKKDEEKLAKLDAAKNANLHYAREHMDDDRSENGDDIRGSDDTTSTSKYVDKRAATKNPKLATSKVAIQSKDLVQLGSSKFSPPVAHSIKKYADEYGVDPHKMANALIAKNSDEEFDKLIGDEEELNFIQNKAEDGKTAHILTNTYKKFGGFEGVEKMYDRIMASPAWTNSERQELKREEEAAVGASSLSDNGSYSSRPSSVSAMPDRSYSSSKDAPSSIKAKPETLTDKNKSELNRSESLFDRVRNRIQNVIRK